MQPKIMLYRGLRIVNDIPAFPENTLGLQRGSHIQTEDATLAEKFQFPIGQPIPLCFDGETVGCRTISWKIEDLIQQINEGVWEISDTEPLPAELHYPLERQLGGQMTIDYFWEKAWDTQETQPEYFRIQTHPDVTADNLKASARTFGKMLLIHAETQPAKITEDNKSASMEIIAGDAGAMDLGLVQEIAYITSLNVSESVCGDRFYICSLRQLN